MVQQAKDAPMNVIFFGKTADLTLIQEFPLFGIPIQAGFPSPADDWQEGKIDLNQFLVKHPAATYLLKVSGSSMRNAGITEGDILLVDCSLEAKHRDIVIASLEGEMTVKRLHKTTKRTALIPENDDYAPIEITSGMEFSIWGVVKYAIKSVS
jgi:DNA polymerase V